MMASGDRCSALTPHTCSVFVVFGLRRHTSIPESVKKKKSPAVVFSASPPAGVHKTPRLYPDRRGVLASSRGVWILGGGGQAHKSRPSPERSSFSDSRWQKRCHTLTRCIDCSPVGSCHDGIGACVFHFQERARAPAACAPHLRAVPGTLSSCILQRTWTWAKSESRTKSVWLCVHTCCSGCYFLHFRLNLGQTTLDSLGSSIKETWRGLACVSQRC